MFLEDNNTVSMDIAIVSGPGAYCIAWHKYMTQRF